MLSPHLLHEQFFAPASRLLIGLAAFVGLAVQLVLVLVLVFIFFIVFVVIFISVLICFVAPTFIICTRAGTG
jgi:hypothetical protein